MSETPTAPIGRREARKAERRARIVAIAQRHFLEHGYDRTSMSAIAEEMGGSKGTLWSYFASKEELFAAVIEQATVSFKSMLAAMLDPARDVTEVLAHVAERFVDRICAPDAIALQRLIIGEVERFPEIGRIFYDRAPGASRALLADYLAGRMAAGLLREDSPREAADMLLGLCAEGYHQRILWGLETQNERVADYTAVLAVKQFLRCYAAG